MQNTFNLIQIIHFAVKINTGSTEHKNFTAFDYEGLGRRKIAIQHISLLRIATSDSL